jgi:serine/threonine protein kinase
MIGQTISHYKILEKLGEGGMGVVYKAQDIKLDRTVALKFMPHHITPDEAEKARFLQEAKAASALNHPNVCTIYGIHDEDEPKFIEMEYVEGVTLRHKLPVQSLAEAITYGVQIGDALHEAHQKGIVHRDIKADNIMINTKNQVKVMDFGLAKLKGSLKLTKATSTVGTLAYMAPEQIQGGDVDARSDIFSYGVLLYEMLTGRMPFRIEHEAALMYSIINDEPDPIQKYRQDLSPVLMNLIQRALEKNPNDRYQSINEMVIELRRLQKQSTKVSRTSLSSMPVQPAPAENQSVSSASVPVAEQTKSKKGILIGISAVALLIIAVVLWKFVFTSSSQMALNPNMTFRTLQIPFQEIGYPSLSRDGGWVAFAGNARGTAWDVYLMNTSSGDPRQITTDSAGFMLDVSLSPDGSQIVYDRSDKGFTRPEVAIVSSLGGFSKRIANIGFNPKWRPDGQRIAYVENPQWGSKSGKTEFRSMKPNGSDDRLEFSDSLQATTLYSWSPDGSEICWTRRTPEGHFEIFARNLESGKERQLTSFKKAIDFVSWTQNNEIVFSSNLNGNDNLWMMPASGGPPVQITRGSGPDIAPAVSADLKRLLYVQQQSIGKIWYSSLQGNDAQQLTFDDVDIADQSFSHDGKKILYKVYTPNPSGGTSAIFSLDLQSRQRTQLLSEETNIHSPLWSPDGKWIVYGAHPDTLSHDSSKTYIIDAENQGSVRQIGVGFPSVWIDNTSFLTTNLLGTWLCTIDGAPVKRFFRDSTFAQPVLDGTYILYSDVNPSRRAGIWLEPASSSGKSSSEDRQVIKSLGSIVYDPISRSVYHTSPENDLRRVSLPDGKEEIVRGTFPNLRLTTSFSISTDGKQITYLDSKRISKLVMIENFH